MTVLGLAWRSIKQRRLSSILTAISVALGVALTIAVMALRQGAQTSFHDTARGYDAILGPTHGSPLQIVLNTMFHVGDAGGTIPWEAYEDAQRDGQVKYAVPYAVGDMFRGHHVVGTATTMFKALEDGDGVPLGEDVQGRLFRDGTHFEAVVGSMVAAKTGLLRGMNFRVTHGVGTMEHGEEWEVVGVMRPTGTPADRAIFIPIDTFYEVTGHEEGADALRERRAERAKEKAAAKAKDDDHDHDGHDHDDHDHDDHDHDDHDGHAHDDDDHAGHDGDDDHDHDHEHGTKEELGLSAIGIRLKSPILRLRYVADIRNDRGTVQAVIPQDQIRAFDVISPIGTLLTWVVILMIIVAGVGTMVSLYNTIQGRRREIAILRAVGARPRHVFSIIVTEALLLCLLGGIAGILLGHASLILIAPYLLVEAGVFLSTGFGSLDGIILLVLAGFGILIGLLPAWNGLRTPVAENLHPTE